MTDLTDTLRIIRHPLVAAALTRLRNSSTGFRDFREAMRDLARFLAYEATSSLPTRTGNVVTPLDLETTGHSVATEVVAVPILRAGLGMVDGFLDILPSADVGFIGLARNEETLEPAEYYCKVPTCEGKAVFVLDPMLATGGSSCKAIEELSSLNPHSITLVTVLASPEGVSAVQQDYPDVTILTAALDEGLNDIGYIVPGLGDAGDRLWGTTE